VGGWLAGTLNKRQTWEAMKKMGADKIYLELKAEGLNPGIPIINGKQGVMVEIKEHRSEPPHKTYWTKR